MEKQEKDGMEGRKRRIKMKVSSGSVRKRKN